MKPKLLTISAIGPYKDKVEIDFTKLGNSGLYLITGDTGAGKTTVFDCICFALYGQTSGTARDDDMLRCKYADNETPSFVKLCFSYNDKDYTVTRVPKYMRKSLRGEKMVAEKGQATLLTPTKTYEGVSEVTSAVTELIGLTKTQFSQIAMIAQGEFLRLLFADTKDRTEIFRSLFSTDNYAHLAESLAEQYSVLKDRYNEKTATLKHICSEIQPCDEFSEITEKWKQSDVIPIPQEVEQAIAGCIKADKAETDRLSKVIEKLDVEISEKQLLCEKANQKEQTLLLISEESKKLAEKVKEYYDICKKQNEIDEQKDNYDRLVSECTLIEATLQNYEKLDAATAESDELNNTIKNANVVLFNCEKRLNELSAKLESDRKELASLRNLELKKAAIKSEFEQCKAKREAARELNRQLEEQAALERDSKTAKENYTKAFSELERINKTVQEAQKSYFSSQAGVLAETLEDGKPCPVCGATEHPKPAKPQSGEVTKQQLDSILKQREAAENTVSAAAQESSAAYGKLQQHQKEVNFRADEFFENGYKKDDIVSLAKQEEIHLSNRCLELKNNAEELVPLINKAKDLEKAVEAFSAELPKVMEEKAAVQKEIAVKTAQLEAGKERLKKLGERLVFKSRKEADNRVSELKAIIEKADLQKKETEKKNAECRESKVAIESGIKTLENQLDKTDYLKSSEYKEMQSQLQNTRMETENALRAAEHRLRTNERQKQLAAACIKKLVETESRIAVIKPLADTAAGKTHGKEKIMLETYVQAAYFERILRRANIRLMAMSGGRYELNRRTQSQNKKSQSGLELDIIDHFGGETIRSVKTLSGGESFEASLALALGLADEVQSDCGGIKLDTMFIDEGFGSLDENSLYQAVQTLQKLGDSNKLIGIISHVGALKSMLERQIIVTKNAEGSTLRVEI